MNIQQDFQLALKLHQTGRLNEAETLYRQILTQHPNHPDVTYYLGVLAGQTGRYELAVDLIRKAITLRPPHPSIYNNLGEFYRRWEKPDEAVAAYRQALALHPKYAEALSNLGSALRDKGQLDEGIQALQQALALQPNSAEIHNNLGNILAEKGALNEAIAAFRRAIALKPDHFKAHSNLGNALRDKGLLDESIAACRQAIAINPNYPEAYNNLGYALQEKGLLDEAIAAFRQALTLKPDYAKAQSNLGNALANVGQLDEAVSIYRQALAQRPNSPGVHSNLIFTLYHHPGYDTAAIHDELQKWNRQHAQPLAQFIQPHPNDRTPDRPLRIGYVSADFRRHASAFFLLPLFENHDPRQVELFCYSQVVRPDEITSSLQKVAPQWRNTIGLSDEQMAAQIRQDKIDLLVDLKLHTDNHRLLVFARKPAPVQLTWLGFPGSTGLTAIDYRLSDPYLDPPGADDSIYAEKTVRLPHTFWCYDPLDAREIPTNPLPALTNKFITFGCLNNFTKINEGVLRLWSKILHAVPDSHLIFLAPDGRSRQHCLELFTREGIAAERIEIFPRQPRQKYLELYHRIDIALDTFPCNGHTTSLDSFWMAVPVITLVGRTTFGRAGLSQLSNLKLPELIANDPEQYLQIAVTFAKDIARLTELRSTLRERMRASPLMDAKAFARAMEAAYRQAWQHWLATPDSPPSESARVSFKKS